MQCFGVCADRKEVLKGFARRSEMFCSACVVFWKAEAHPASYPGILFEKSGRLGGVALAFRKVEIWPMGVCSVFAAQAREGFGVIGGIFCSAFVAFWQGHARFAVRTKKRNVLQSMRGFPEGPAASGTLSGTLI